MVGIGPKGIDLAGDSEGKRKWGPKLRPRSWACLHQKQEPLILMGDKAEREYPSCNVLGQEERRQLPLPPPRAGAPAR